MTFPRRLSSMDEDGGYGAGAATRLRLERPAGARGRRDPPVPTATRELKPTLGVGETLLMHG